MVEAYREFKNEDGFSKVIDIKKIKENGCNLNVTLYVSEVEETEEINVTKKCEELLKLEVGRIEV